jgi:hypothetical protein
MADRLDEILDRVEQGKPATDPGQLIAPPPAPAAPAPAAPAPLVAPVAPEARAARDPLDSILDRADQGIKQEEELARRSVAFKAANTKLPPAKHAELVGLQAVTGYDPEYILEHYDEIRPEVKQAEIEKALASSPALQRVMADASRAAAVQDDIANASQLEWWITGKWHVPRVKVPIMGGRVSLDLPGAPELDTAPAWARAFMDGAREREYNARAAAAWAGETSPENERRMAELRPALTREYGADNVATQAFIGAFRNVLELAAEGTGSLAGVFAGSALTPAAPPVGGAVGGYVAGATFDFFDNVGAVYMDLRDLKDPSGKRLIDDDAARRYAFGASAIGSAITGGLVLRGAKMLPGFEKVIHQLTKRTVTEALEEAAFGRAAARFAKDWTLGTVTGAAMMAVQAGVNQGAQQVATAKALDRPTDWQPVFDATVQGFKQGLVEMSLLAAWGPGHAYLERRGMREHALAEHARDAAITETAVASQILKDNPDLGAEVAAEAAREMGAVTHKFVDVGAWTKLAQERGFDPAKGAAELVGDDGRAWLEAQESGRLAVPIQAWLAKVQDTDFTTALAQDVTLSPDTLTPRQEREREKMLKKLEELKKDSADPVAAQLAEVEAEYFRQFAAAGRGNTNARALAKLVREAVEALASDKGWTPQKVLETYPLVVKPAPGKGAVPVPRAPRAEPPPATASVLDGLTGAAVRAEAGPLGAVPDPVPATLGRLEAEKKARQAEEDRAALTKAAYEAQQKLTDFREKVGLKEGIDPAANPEAAPPTWTQKDADELARLTAEADALDQKVRAAEPPPAAKPQARSEADEQLAGTLAAVAPHDAADFAAAAARQVGPGAAQGLVREDGAVVFDADEAARGLAEDGNTTSLKQGIETPEQGRFLRGSAKTKKPKDQLAHRVVARILKTIPKVIGEGGKAEVYSGDAQWSSLADALAWAEKAQSLEPVVNTEDRQELRWGATSYGKTWVVGNEKMAFPNNAYPHGRNTWDDFGCGRRPWAELNQLSEILSCYGGKCYADAIAKGKGGTEADVTTGVRPIGLHREDARRKNADKIFKKAGGGEAGLAAVRAKYPELIAREISEQDRARAAKEGKTKGLLSLKILPNEPQPAVVYTNLQGAKGQDIRLGVDTDGGAWLTKKEVLDAMLEADPRIVSVYSSGYYAAPPPHPLSRRAIINVTVSGWHPIGETLSRLKYAEAARANGWNVILREVTADPEVHGEAKASVYNRLHEALLGTDFFLMQQPLHEGKKHGKELWGLPGCCIGSKKNAHKCDQCEVTEGLGNRFQAFWGIAEDGQPTEKVLPDVADYRALQLRDLQRGKRGPIGDLKGTITYTGPLAEGGAPPPVPLVTIGKGTMKLRQEDGPRRPPLHLVTGEEAAPDLGALHPREAWDAIARHGADPTTLTDDQLLGLLAWNDPNGAWNDLRSMPRKQEEFRQALAALAKDAGVRELKPEDLEEIAAMEDEDYPADVRKRAAELDEGLAKEVSWLESEFRHPPARAEILEVLQEEMKANEPVPEAERVPEGPPVPRIGADHVPLTLEVRRARPVEKTAALVQDGTNGEVMKRIIPLMAADWPGRVDPGPMGMIGLLASKEFQGVLNATAWGVRVESLEQTKRKKTRTQYFISTTGQGVKDRAASLVLEVKGDELVVTMVGVNKPKAFEVDATTSPVGRAALEEGMRGLVSAAWTLADDQGLTLKVEPAPAGMTDAEMAGIPLEHQKSIAVARRAERLIRANLEAVLATQAKEAARPDAKVTRLRQGGLEGDQIARYAKLGLGTKDFADQRYPHTIGVLVTFRDGTTHFDAVKGLNAGHALARAAANWSDARRIEIVTPTTLEAGGARGEIEFTIPDSPEAPVRFDMTLLKYANESTGAHEIGHWMGLVLGQVAEQAGATEKHKELYRTALDFMGYKDHAQRISELNERKVLEDRIAAGETLSPAEEERRKAIEAKEERFSHGFEIFLAEGKAPSPQLRGVFAAFTLWMKKLYRNLQGVAGAYKARYGEDLVLSPEVRRMFDRLLVAEEAAAEADLELGGGEFKLPDETPAEKEQIERARAAEREEHEQEVLRLLTEDEARARSEHMTEERERFRVEVEGELDRSPTYRALRFLRDGEVPEGQTPPPGLTTPDGKPRRLDRAELLTRYSPEFVRSLPPRVTQREGGVPADLVAEAFGFATGDDLVKALQEAPSRERFVAGEVQRRMEDLYGRALVEDPQRLAEKALEAAHTAKRVEQIVTGMRIMARRLAPELNARFRAVDTELLQKKADALMRTSKVGEISAAKELRSERSAGRRAVELAAAGRIQAAYDAREAQLWHHLLWRSARDAEERSEKMQATLRKYTTDQERAKLGMVPGDYLARVDDLLDSIEFREGVSRAAVARRREYLEASGGNRTVAATFAAWLEEQRALNRDAVIPPRLLENLDRTRHWKDLTLAELEDLTNAVTNIAHLAHTKDKLLGAKDKREKVAVLKEMYDRAIETFGLDPTIVDRNTLSFKKRAIRLIKKAEAGVIRPEELIIGLDGGREDGPFHQYLYQPITDAHAKWQDLAERIQKPIVAELEALPLETKLYLRRHRFTVNGQPYTMEAALAVAFNWGNASNRQKTVEGWTSNESIVRQGIKPWEGEKTAEEFLKQVDAKPELWALVQRVWKGFDSHHDEQGNLVAPGTPGAISLWEEAADLERRLTGLAPPKIEPQAFERVLADGTRLKLEGGYYPMVYDKRFSKQGATAAEKDGELPTLFQKGSERAITPHGHLVERIESFRAPVELSLVGLFRHLSHATKDIAMREALISVHSLITDQRFRDLIQVTAGEDSLKVLDRWIVDTANDLVIPDGGEGIYLQTLNATRRGLTASIFVANAGQALQNLAGFGNVLNKVDAKYLWKGVQLMAENRRAQIEFVNRLSGEMRHRTKTFDRDVKDQLHQLLGKHGSLARAKEVGLWALQATDMTVAYPTWLGAYHMALDGKVEGVGSTQEEAVRHADMTVRRTLSSGATKDLPALMRSPQGKMITMFYGFASAQLNQVIGAGTKARVEWNDGQKYKATRTMSRIWFTVVGGAILAELLTGRGPSDYDDDGRVTAADWSKWMALRATLAPFTLIPLVGTVARATESGRDASLMPYQSVFTDAARVARAGWKTGLAVVTQDEPLEELGNLGRTMARASYTILPGGAQARASVGYWTDENRNPLKDSPVEQVLGTTFGKKREGRLSTALFGEE